MALVTIPLINLDEKRDKQHKRDGGQGILDTSVNSVYVLCSILFSCGLVPKEALDEHSESYAHSAEQFPCRLTGGPSPVLHQMKKKCFPTLK